MRMSCNGCRVLRKGCNEKCKIRPCLDWIKSSESQANATVFLAKFYGRAGLINLISAGPDHLRPALFRSLLYESCGRMVNPIYGSVGLLWSGQWQLCQTAVESVLKGVPITPISVEDAANPPPVKGAYDIRHVSKEKKSDSSHSDRTKPNQTRFKRSGGVVKPKPTKLSSTASAIAALEMLGKSSMQVDANLLNGSSTSHDSSVSHPYKVTTDGNSNSNNNSNSCMVSVETTDDDVVERANNGGGGDNGDRVELELELTLGFKM
ncbi:hypothetical protein RND81_03G177500 [Saponaria officinalis]|uniref:LOB domain-containing protein n=1 Tax=Saponaria officinalis TaxID=3572 RepID=A0AAW1M149_SAPOF